MADEQRLKELYRPPVFVLKSKTFYYESGYRKHKYIKTRGLGFLTKSKERCRESLEQTLNPDPEIVIVKRTRLRRKEQTNTLFENKRRKSKFVQRLCMFAEQVETEKQNGIRAKTKAKVKGCSKNA